MKTSTEILLQKVKGYHLSKLTKEVRETLDIPFKNYDVPKKFTAAQLWRIHKMKRSIPVRKFY